MSPGRVLHRLRYVVSDAWDEWRHSPAVNLLATLTLAGVLLVGGLQALVLSNVERRVAALRDAVPLQVYLRDGVEAAARERLQAEIERFDGVARVAYVDADEALRRYREWAADRAQLIDELPGNPLPASFEVHLAPGPGSRPAAERLAGRFAARPEVEQVSFDVAWLDQLERLLTVGRRLGVGFAALVLAVVALVVGAVLRLAVHARREEIEIMLLVGASPGLVRGPFLVSGLAQGFAGAALALGLLEALRRMAVDRAADALPVLVDLVAAHPLPPGVVGTVLALGAALGLVGAWIAVLPETNRRAASGL